MASDRQEYGFEELGIDAYAENLMVFKRRAKKNLCFDIPQSYVKEPLGSIVIKSKSIIGNRSISQ